MTRIGEENNFIYFGLKTNEHNHNNEQARLAMEFVLFCLISFKNALTISYSGTMLTLFSRDRMCKYFFGEDLIGTTTKFFCHLVCINYEYIHATTKIFK